MLRILTTYARRARLRTSSGATGTGRPAAGREGGFTLVEYIVAMGIFSIVIGVIVGGVNVMTNDLRKATSLSDATSVGRLALTRLDKQVRYANAINRPVKVGSDWYVEFSSTNSTGVKTCYQWRLVASTDTLQQRTWADTGSAPSSAPTWQTVAKTVVNDPTTQQPFTFLPSTTYPLQGLSLYLVVSTGKISPGTVSTRTSIFARNTYTGTATNDDANSDGASDNPVCQNGVGRP